MGSISISPSGVVTITSLQSGILFCIKLNFQAKVLNSGGDSIQVSFNFVDQSNQQLGNSSSAFSVSVGGLAINSQCYLEQYFQVPPLGQLSFSVNIVTKSSDPPVYFRKCRSDRQPVFNCRTSILNLMKQFH